MFSFTLLIANFHASVTISIFIRIFVRFSSKYREIGNDIRDLFHVYLNRFEFHSFHFSRLHIIKTNTFCFFMHNGRVPGIAK